MENERLKKQLEFLLTLDKLKNVYRQTYILCDDLPQGSAAFEENFKERKPLPRRENDAEHSFSLAIAAAVLAEYSNEPVDITKVMKMVLVHDAVEIYAGDTYCYDDEGAKTKEAREKAAAEKVFGTLPEEQAEEFRALWEKFEANDTAEAKFSNAMDRIQPLLLNFSREGISWKEHGVHSEQVKKRFDIVKDGSTELGIFVDELLDKAVENGFLLH
ncbi:MAG: HD domain-containing protein [Oscillospiraceae bacterium]